RLIVLGIAPSAGNLPPARLGRTVEEMVAADRVLEVDAVRLYEQAVLHAERMRDADSAALLKGILAEEIAHVRELDDMSQGSHHG
ncbi:MAG: ferritin-like domain-containing protein, partial [Hoeflea sp.]|nr:ferritin-like domain-containing protein [Hoeflea sp.]